MWTIGFAITALLLPSSFLFQSLLQPQVSKRISLSNNSSKKLIISTITALGRIEPQGEVIFLSPSPTLEGARLDKLLIKEGDKVKSGQLVAILDSHERLLATLKEANAQVKVSQERLSQVLSGEKLGKINAQKATLNRIKAQLYGEINAQKATLARFESEFRNAKAEYERYKALYQEGAISTSIFDDKRLKIETVGEQVKEEKTILNRIITTGQKQLQEAKATLQEISEVRPVDVAVAKAELESAIASSKKAKTNLELAYVRSPVDGYILKIHTRRGEFVQDHRIASLGQIEQMYVVAEIQETDISKIRLKQPANIISEYGGFSGELKGTVEEIGKQINKKDIIDMGSSAKVDVRVIEVKIKLNPEDSKRVKFLTNLTVRVSIHSI